jgi:hypothetical protein
VLVTRRKSGLSFSPTSTIDLFEMNVRKRL